jgi:hypothetical protein
MNMISGDSAGAGVRAKSGRRKNELPWPFPGGAWVFSQERLGNVGFTAYSGQVLRVLFFLPLEMRAKFGFKGSRKW